jgi:hypothetical protein
MKWQRGTLADFMADNVVYRNLEPMWPELAGLRASWAEIGLDHYYVPRKTSPEYARALVHFMHRAQALRGEKQALQRLLVIGDTLMNDGTAARNAGEHLPMMGFIGADRLAQPAKSEVQSDLLVANRWAALAEFVEWVGRADFACDERTAMLIDLDKTSLGARGRNDHVIDRARVQAVQRTMQGALGDDFDEAAFRAVYDPLNQPDYHYFTADNQDYLAYICLMVSGGVYPPDDLWPALEAQRISSFDGFVTACDERQGSMSTGLREAHDEVRRGLAAQDPTPFKGFRRGEYLETLACMDVLDDGADEAAVLNAEIVITEEVASVARYMAERGVLIFGISDKPDEASVPTVEQAARGMQPIHRATMKVYGESVV